MRLEPGEYELVLRPRNVDEGRTLPDEVGVVTLDTAVDDELESEGLARDVVRLVQAATARRRPARFGLHRRWRSSPRRPMAGAVEAHRSYVAEQTLAVAIEVSVGSDVSLRVTKAPCPGGLSAREPAVDPRVRRPERLRAQRGAMAWG